MASFANTVNHILLYHSEKVHVYYNFEVEEKTSLLNIAMQNSISGIAYISLPQLNDTVTVVNLYH